MPEYLGLVPKARAGTYQVSGDGKGAQWYQKFRDGGASGFEAMMDLLESLASADELVSARDVAASTWKQSVAMADAAYEPGMFTTLAGYEWTSMPAGNNLHRVVIFRDDANKTAQVAPFSLFDSENPEDLWDHLDGYEKKTGGSVLAIPHNGNVSNGLMFTESKFDGSPMDRSYAEKRQRWEPVMEVTQIKGDGETHPLLSPNDEFADYGTWDGGNIAGSALKQEWMLQYEYARSALRTGLEFAERTGANPYQFGMIGSTDSHTSLATAEEDNFWGKSAVHEPGSEMRNRGPFLEYADQKQTIMAWEQVAAGYAAVWARDNTREEIFDALKRREVYATTGPRITLRFFGGWNYAEDDVHRSDMVRIGYQRGVPMGSELPPSDADAPVFMIAAMKDAVSANLDRIQVVKGWVDAKGQSHERIYNVAWAGSRKPDRKGNLPAIGNTVSPDDVRYTNSIGAVQLATVWRDPDFDSSQRAFYYLRVLEIPTPRWVAYDRQRLGDQLASETQLTHQERAYSSPIWYQPD